MKRYSLAHCPPDAWMSEDKEGDYVRYDYAMHIINVLRQQNASLVRHIERSQEVILRSVFGPSNEEPVNGNPT